MRSDAPTNAAISHGCTNLDGHGHVAWREHEHGHVIEIVQSYDLGLSAHCSARHDEGVIVAHDLVRLAVVTL